MATLVHHLELSQPVKAIERAGDYNAVHVYLQWRGKVISRLTIANDYREISAKRLRTEIAQRYANEILPWLLAEPGSIPENALAHDLADELVQKSIRSEDKTGFLKTLFASIVLCTLDRPQDLEICLQSLTQHQAIAPFEIIVVDNNPASGLTAPVAARFPLVRYITEGRRGLSYARNAGIRVAQGNIIVCTDDDVIFAENWLDNLLKPFERPQVMSVTGCTLPKNLEAASAELYEEYGGLFRGFGRIDYTQDVFRRQKYRYLPTWRIGATANAAFRAEIFLNPQIGPFDEGLGPGTPAGVGEDTYLFYKILQQGYACAYEPLALVYHSHRREMKALRKQLFDYSKGHISYHLTTLLRDHDQRALLYLAVILPGKTLRRIRWRLQSFTFYPLDLLALEIWGYLNGPVAYFKALRRARKLGRTLPEDFGPKHEETH